MSRMALEDRAVELLRQLIRHRTVNPPGDERALQEELAAEFEQAGFEVSLVGRTPERPNLVARLRGEADGPVLGLLWLDHAHNIRNIGDYINTTLRPLMASILGVETARVLSWEEHVDLYERRALLRFVPLGVPVLVLFAAVPIVSLARTVGDVVRGRIVLVDVKETNGHVGNGRVEVVGVDRVDRPL